MQRIMLMLALVSSSFIVAAQQPLECAEDPALNERYQEFIQSIRCMKCQNQSIADSPIDQAADLRRMSCEMMVEGQSNGEIRSYLVSRYGDFISYWPQLRPSTWLLWSAPGLLLIGGGFVFFRVLRTRMQQPLDEDADS